MPCGAFGSPVKEMPLWRIPRAPCRQALARACAFRPRCCCYSCCSVAEHQLLPCMACHAAHSHDAAAAIRCCCFCCHCELLRRRAAAVRMSEMCVRAAAPRPVLCCCRLAETCGRSHAWRCCQYRANADQGSTAAALDSYCNCAATCYCDSRATAHSCTAQDVPARQQISGLLPAQ